MSSRKAHMNIIKYLLRHGSSRMVDIYKACTKGTDQHTNYNNAKDELIKANTIYEDVETGKIEFNYKCEYQMLKDITLRMSLLNSGAIDDVLTDRGKLRLMTFMEAWEIFKKVKKSIPLKYIKKLMRSKDTKQIIKNELNS